MKVEHNNHSVESFIYLGKTMGINCMLFTKVFITSQNGQTHSQSPNGNEVQVSLSARATSILDRRYSSDQVLVVKNGDHNYL
jgi:hypothetical protein